MTKTIIPRILTATDIINPVAAKIRGLIVFVIKTSYKFSICQSIGAIPFFCKKAVV